MKKETENNKDCPHFINEESKRLCPVCKKK